VQLNPIRSYLSYLYSVAYGIHTTRGDLVPINNNNNYRRWRVSTKALYLVFPTNTAPAMKASVSRGISVREVFETRLVGVLVYSKYFRRPRTMIVYDGRKYNISIYSYVVVEGSDGCQRKYPH